MLTLLKLERNCAADGVAHPESTAVSHYPTAAIAQHFQVDVAAIRFPPPTD